MRGRAQVRRHRRGTRSAVHGATAGLAGQLLRLRARLRARNQPEQRPRRPAPASDGSRLRVRPERRRRRPQNPSLGDPVAADRLRARRRRDAPGLHPNPQQRRPPGQDLRLPVSPRGLGLRRRRGRAHRRRQRRPESVLHQVRAHLAPQSYPRRLRPGHGADGVRPDGDPEGTSVSESRSRSSRQARAPTRSSSPTTIQPARAGSRSRRRRRCRDRRPVRPGSSTHTYAPKKRADDFRAAQCSCSGARCRGDARRCADRAAARRRVPTRAWLRINAGAEPDATAASNYGSLPLSFQPNAGRGDPSLDFVTHTSAASVYLDARGRNSGACAGTGERGADSADADGRSRSGHTARARTPPRGGQRPSRRRSGALGDGDPDLRARSLLEPVPGGGARLVRQPAPPRVRLPAVTARRPEPDRGSHGRRRGPAPRRQRRSRHRRLRRADPPTRSGRVPAGRARRTPARRRRRLRRKRRTRVGFELGAYDKRRAARHRPRDADLLRPTSAAATVDEGRAIAVDPAGAAYIAGSTTLGRLPIASAPIEGDEADVDAFVTKLNAGRLGARLLDLPRRQRQRPGPRHRGRLGRSCLRRRASPPRSTSPSATSSRPTAATMTPSSRSSTPAGSALAYSTYLGGTSVDRGVRDRDPLRRDLRHRYHPLDRLRPRRRVRGRLGGRRLRRLRRQARSGAVGLALARLLDLPRRGPTTRPMESPSTPAAPPTSPASRTRATSISSARSRGIRRIATLSSRS